VADSGGLPPMPIPNQQRYLVEFSTFSFTHRGKQIKSRTHNIAEASALSITAYAVMINNSHKAPNICAEPTEK